MSTFRTDNNVVIQRQCSTNADASVSEPFLNLLYLLEFLSTLTPTQTRSHSYVVNAYVKKLSSTINMPGMIEDNSLRHND